MNERTENKSLNARLYEFGDASAFTGGIGFCSGLFSGYYYHKFENFSQLQAFYKMLFGFGLGTALGLFYDIPAYFFKKLLTPKDTYEDALIAVEERKPVNGKINKGSLFFGGFGVSLAFHRCIVPQLFQEFGKVETFLISLFYLGVSLNLGMAVDSLFKPKIDKDQGHGSNIRMNL